MNILLTTAKAPDNNYFNTQEKLFPLGLGFLASVLRGAGHEVFFLDPYYEPSERYNIEYLLKNDIDIVGIYACTICFKDVLRQVCFLREEGWQGKIIIGGPHCSVVEMSEYKGYIDHVVDGEAEGIIVDLVEGKIGDYSIKSRQIDDLDSLPIPSYDLIGNRNYRCHDKNALQPLFNMNTSRGCPYNCSFCSSGPISGRKYRYQSAERIIEDIIYLKSTFNARSIYFRENNFCVSKERTVRFCEILLEKGIELEWRCETSVKDLSKELLILMKRAGCRGLFVGFETGSERLLKLFKPGFSMDENIKAANLCRELQIPMHASFLVGTPYDTEEDIQKTLDFIEKYIPKGQSCINVYIGLHGSRIYKELYESGDYTIKDDLGLIYTKNHDDNIRRFHKITSPTHRLLSPKSRTDAKIAVIMSVFNEGRFLKESINSILAQTFEDFIFLIVDDGSPDNSRSIINEYKDSRIYLFINGKNEGQKINLNYLLEYIEREFPDISYIAMQDGDDISHPERIEKQVVFLEENPEYALVGSFLKIIDEQGLEIGSVSNLPTETISIKRTLPLMNTISHGAVMFRSSCLYDVGFYDTSIPFSQEYELIIRLASRYEVSNLPEYLYSWRMSRKDYIYEKNNENIFESSRRNLILKNLGYDISDQMHKESTSLVNSVGKSKGLNWQDIFTGFNKVKNRLINLFSQQKVVFYGAGLAAELFYKSMREQINITAFVDWNINLHFTRFENDTTVYPPDYLKFLDYDVVLITPLNRKDEISFFLRSFLDESKMSKLVYLEDMLKETM